ncbi:MAG: insulinase family protein [Cyclobacteriaceae bacterium]|nr:insulinase family protein [Cyclobacteriaceae bacterium]
MKKLIYILLCVALFSSGVALAQKPDRTTPPALSKAKNLQLPPIQRFSLSNGLPVILMEKHTVPLVQINLLIQTGSFDDPAGKEGLSNFAMDLLDEGAGAFSSLQLADEIEFLGANISTYSGSFASGINCAASSAKIEATLKLMTDIALNPTFAENEIERIRKNRLNGLLQNYDEPNIISRRAFDRLLYDKSTPYGRFPNEASIKTYSKDDLTAFHKTHFVTGNSTLIIVGDVTQQSITPVLEKYFGSFPKGQATTAVKPVPQQVKGRQIYIVDKPGAAQSVIRIGRIGVPRNAPDQDNIEVMNTILGGSFASRLNTNLRETHGYSYGAGSAFSFWKIPGPFIASSSVQTDVTGPALGEFFVEFKKIRQPLPDADLTRGKNYEALGYAGNFETSRDIASALVDLVLYQLPDNYFNTYVEKILAVNKKGVEAAAKKYIVPENMLIVIVGDKAKIEAGVQKLNLGKITYLTIEDILGKKPEL